jgi:hypothetical protein
MALRTGEDVKDSIAENLLPKKIQATYSDHLIKKNE